MTKADRSWQMLIEYIQIFSPFQHKCRLRSIHLVIKINWIVCACGMKVITKKTIKLIDIHRHTHTHTHTHSQKKRDTDYANLQKKKRFSGHWSLVLPGFDTMIQVKKEKKWLITLVVKMTGKCVCLHSRHAARLSENGGCVGGCARIAVLLATESRLSDCRTTATTANTRTNAGLSTVGLRLRAKLSLWWLALCDHFFLKREDRKLCAWLDKQTHTHTHTHKHTYTKLIAANGDCVVVELFLCISFWKKTGSERPKNKIWENSNRFVFKISSPGKNGFFWTSLAHELTFQWTKCVWRMNGEDKLTSKKGTFWKNKYFFVERNDRNCTAVKLSLTHTHTYSVVTCRQPTHAWPAFWMTSCSDPRLFLLLSSHLLIFTRSPGWPKSPTPASSQPMNSRWRWRVGLRSDPGRRWIPKVEEKDACIRLLPSAIVCLLVLDQLHSSDSKHEQPKWMGKKSEMSYKPKSKGRWGTGQEVPELYEKHENRLDLPKMQNLASLVQIAFAWKPGNAAIKMAAKLKNY